MTWQRQVDLYIDLDSFGTSDNPLLKISATSSTRASAPVFVAGDKIKLNLHLMQFENALGQWVSQQITGSTLIMCAKQLAADDSCLFSVSTFVEVESGGAYYYQGALDLNTNEIAELTYTGGYAAAHADIEIQNADNSQRATIQFSVRIAEQYYTGTEGDPTEGDPTYPAPGSLVLKFIGTESMSDKTATVDTSSAGFASTPKIIITVESPEMIFAVVRNITTTAFDVELSAYYPTTKVHWLAVL